MDFFDFIKELRKGEPDVKRAAKAMKILGWISILGAVWNFAFFYLVSFEEFPINGSPLYPYLALICFTLQGVLFFFFSRGIKKQEPWGKKVGQLAIITFVTLLLGSMFFLFPLKELPLGNDMFSVVFALFLCLALAQFWVPSYFGVRYLGRLPVKENVYAEDRFRPEDHTKVLTEETLLEHLEQQIKYKDSPFPFGIFGIFGTFGLLLAIFFVIFFIAGKYVGMEIMSFLFLPAFLFIFFGPVAYNYVSSPFQKGRNLVASFTGGGSIFLFNGSWPFFRLLVYTDGVEIRSTFHRYFIPYNKMEDIPDKIGFFNRGILIRSDLPDVPSGIRFSGFGMKKILKVVNETKNEHLSKT